MRGWLANVLRAEIASIHRICQKSADKICLCVWVHKRARKAGEEGWPLANWCLSASKPWFHYYVTVHHTKAFSEHQLCYTHTHKHMHTLIHIFLYIYIHTLAAFSQAGLSYSICITETMEWAESLLTWLGKHFFGNNWLSNIHFCVFNKEKIFMI